MDWVDPRMAALLAESSGTPAVDLMALPVDEARAAYHDRWRPWNAALRPMHEVTDHSVARNGSPIAVRVYRPTAQARGTIVYAHGGGWRFGSIESHDALVRELAAAANAVAVSIDYRLSPEHAYPAGVDDVLCAIEAIEMQRMPGAAGPLVLAGDSAGATLVLSALTRRDRPVEGIAGAALFYGCFDVDFETQSYRQFGDGRFGLSRARLETYWRDYLGTSPGEPPREALPGRAELEGLPPLYLHAAGLDTLASDTLLLSERLHAAGVPYELALSPGLVHGHLQMAARLEPARQVLRDAGRFLRAVLDAATA